METAINVLGYAVPGAILALLFLPKIRAVVRDYRSPEQRQKRRHERLIKQMQKTYKS